MIEAQKARLIHDELLELVTYRHLNRSVDDIRGAFIHKGVLCEGYARTLTYLYQLAGIEVIYVTGKTSAGYHAGVKAKIDILQYKIDPTWDDSITGDSGVYHTPDQDRYAQPLPTSDNATEDYPLENTEYPTKNQKSRDPNAALMIYTDPKGWTVRFH